MPKINFICQRKRRGRERERERAGPMHKTNTTAYTLHFWYVISMLCIGHINRHVVCTNSPNVSREIFASLKAYCRLIVIILWNSDEFPTRDNLLCIHTHGARLYISPAKGFICKFFYIRKAQPFVVFTKFHLQRQRNNLKKYMYRYGVYETKIQYKLVI